MAPEGSVLTVRMKAVQEGFPLVCHIIPQDVSVLHQRVPDGYLRVVGLKITEGYICV